MVSLRPIVATREVGQRATSRVPQPRDEGIVGAGEAVIRAGEQQDRLQQAQEATDASLKLSQFQAQQMQAMQEAQRNAGKGAPNFERDFMQQFDQSRTALLENVSPRVRAQVATRSMNLRNQALADSIKFQDNARVTSIGQDIDDMVSAEANMTAIAPDNLGSALERVNEAISNSGMREDVKREMRIKAGGTLYGSHEAARLTDDAEGLLVDLEDGRYDSVLRDDQKADAINRAFKRAQTLQRQAIIDAERWDRLIDKQTDDEQEANFELLATQAFNQNQPLSDIKIEQAQADQLITSSQAEKLKSIRDRELEGRSDPVVLMDLNTKEIDGELTVNDVLNASDGNDISQDDALDLMRRIEQSRQAGGILANANVKISRKRVQEAVSGAGGDMVSFSGEELEDALNADRQFIRMVVDEGMDPAEAEQRVIRAFTARRERGLPRPMLANKPRDMNGVNEARRLTLQAFEDGVITEQQFIEQDQLLLEYERSFTSQGAQ